MSLTHLPVTRRINVAGGLSTGLIRNSVDILYLRMVNPSTAALGTRVRLETRLRTSDAMAERHAASEAARSLPYGLGHGWAAS